MKIIQVIPEMNAGGVERGTREIASFLAREGHESVVISNGGRMVPSLVEDGARHLDLAVHRKHPSSLLQVAAMRDILKKERPDVVHYRSRVPGWITWLAWSGMDPSTRPRLVSTVHGFYSVNAYSSVMLRGERTIAVSESVRDYVLANYRRARRSRIHLVYRGIEPDRYHPEHRPSGSWMETWRARFPWLASKWLLLLPGRITRLKGHEEFLRLVAALAAAGLPVQGLIAGDTHPDKTTYLDEIRSLASAPHIQPYITFLGHRDDLRDVMAVSDAVFALSTQPEAFGRTVLEALALGKPVVGYNCGGVGELLARFFPEGRVPLGDFNQLERTATAVLRHGSRPTTVGEPFTLDHMCRSTLDIYQELVKSPRPTRR